MLYRIGSRQAFPLALPRLINQQNSIVDDQPQKNDEAHHGQQVQRLSLLRGRLHDHVENTKHGHTADCGQRNGN